MWPLLEIMLQRVLKSGRPSEKREVEQAALKMPSGGKVRALRNYAS